MSSFKLAGGDEGDRTPDPLLAGQVLSQLSYTPTFHHLCDGLLRLPLASSASNPNLKGAVRAKLPLPAPPASCQILHTLCSTVAGSTQRASNPASSRLAAPSKLNNITKSFQKKSVLPCLTSHIPALAGLLLRKEVIQPHLPIRLPCYDFTPIINPTFGSALLAVRLLTSGVTDSHGVTGGVYKARERIHRGMLIRDY